MDKLPGLSVWTWGPVLWQLLHCIAWQSDSKQVYDKEILQTFFTSLQPLLPCKYCRNSYGGFLKDVEALRKETVGQAVEKRHLVAFVYDLHNKVNAKLAKQRWAEVKGILKAKLSDTDALDCMTLEEEVLQVLDKKPTLQTVLKRGLLYEHEPVNLEGLLLVAIVFAMRVGQAMEQTWNYCLFLSTIQNTLAKIPTLNYQLLSTRLKMPVFLASEVAHQRADPESLIESLKTVYFDFYASGKVDRATFEASLKEKIQNMHASACGAGTCA